MKRTWFVVLGVTAFTVACEREAPLTAVKGLGIQASTADGEPVLDLSFGDVGEPKGSHEVLVTREGGFVFTKTTFEGGGNLSEIHPEAGNEIPGTARVWQTGSGREVVVLRGHTDWVGHVAFSPDGRRVVTASGDRTARIYVTRFDDLLRLAEARLPVNLTPQERQDLLRR